MQGAGERLELAWSQLHQEQGMTTQEYAQIVQAVADAECRRAKEASRRLLWDKALGLVCAAAVLVLLILMLTQK